MKSFYLLALIASISLVACKDTEPLKKLGEMDISENGDTTFYTIPDFTFTNQIGQKITNETFKDQIYVVDFFFTFCPSICPIVKDQMIRIYDEFEDTPELQFVSHTLAPRQDSIPALKKYADKLKVSADRWHFVTGNEDLIYDMADAYFISAEINDNAPGGFDHSGRLILVDKNRHIRASCEGTDPASVDQFMKDIKKLLNEK